MARKLTPQERAQRSVNRSRRELYAIVDEITEALYKGHVKRKGFTPNPVQRAALVDKFYLRACRTVGVDPIERKETK